MPASRYMLNKILNYVFGTTAYTPPTSYYVGLSTTKITDITNISASVTAVAFSGKVVTLTAANIFKEGDSIIVAGVDADTGDTNVDGTWTCDAGTNSATIVYTIVDDVTGTAGAVTATATGDLMTEVTNGSASVTAMAYTVKAVTLTANNSFSEGDIVVVAGVNAGFTVTNIDGTWVCTSGTNATTIKFTVTNQPVGATPQTISVGTVTDSYARVAYSNDNNVADWTLSTVGETSNVQAMTFLASSLAWGTVVSVFLADASSAGNILWYYTLSPEITVGGNPTVVSFAIGDVIGSLA